MRNCNTYLLLLLFSLLIGCEKFAEQDKFKRPDWLPGKLYTTVLAQEDLSMFAECLRLSGLDSIIDVSGSWTVFAPTNEAMKEYLVVNNYSKISDIPMNKLSKIAKFHIIQNPWSLEQLQSLSIFGWRTSDNSNTNSYAYKRETILKNSVEKYWIKKENNDEMIVSDSTTSNAYKKVFVESRKYAPIFYDKFMDVNGLSSADFSFYFDRPYEHGNVYFAGAKILQSDIFAENGFVHTIDRVVNPMLNAKEMLERELPGESYKLFLEMIDWYYPTFKANMTATQNQPEFRLGGFVDTLWDLNYAGIAFSLQKEKIGYQEANINETLVRHNGLIAPTDNAFGQFINGTLTLNSGFPHWRDIRSLPPEIVDIIITNNLKSSAIYPSSNQYNGIFRGNGRYKQNEGDIIRTEFGSNCTFIGIDGYIPDRLFTSITGPVFLRPAYSLFRQAIIYSRIQDLLANYNGELAFFPMPDYGLKADSSLMLNWIDKDRNIFNFQELNRKKHLVEGLGRNEISSRIMNHVATSLPNGSANKEFIRTLGGNFIIWNNSDGTVQGDLPSTIGFNGVDVEPNPYTSMDEPASNGKAWSVRYWFNFGNRGLLEVLLEHPRFFSLVQQTGLYGHGFPFLNSNENYTLFLPSDEAIENFQADTLSRAELTRIVKYHFLRGAIIFTDNKQSSGKYNTTSGDSLDIQTGPDVIEILDETGNPYVIIPEDEETTNIMVSENSRVFLTVHVIDKVLIP